LVLASILPFPALAELAADAAPGAVLVDVGPHQRTWQTVRQIDTGHGLVPQTNQYLEIQTGLNHSTANGWVETSPRIDLSDGLRLSHDNNFFEIVLAILV
jgi:hypothetical protein